MIPMPGFLVYLADCSSLINMVNSKTKVRTRYLTTLLKNGRLKLPDAVARELRRCDDVLKSWVERHQDKWFRCTNENTADLHYVSTKYSTFLIRDDKKTAADPVIICMAKFYRSSGWTVLADDAGIQAACLMEDLPYCTSQAFRVIEHI
jgi:hypothetical protein